MLDDAVLAGRVHGLDDHQHRPAVLRVEPLLQLGQPLDAFAEHFLGFVLVEVEAAGIGRIDVGQAELVRLVDAVALDDLGEVHAPTLSSPDVGKESGDERRHASGSRSAGPRTMRISASSGSRSRAR